MMTVVREHTTSAPAAFAACPACTAAWSSDATIKIPVADESGDEMLTAALRHRLSELTYERCRGCRSLIATDLRRDPALLDEIYRNLPESYWQGLNPQCGLHREIERRLSERGMRGGDLWDVGCGSGSVLEEFGKQWNKSGIEPGLTAVAEARARGLNVLAGTASGLQFHDLADVVISIDVVEHLPQPEIELRAMHDMLRPGGVLAILTGTADAWTARFAGPRWYYLHCIGHVTVFSRGALPAQLSQIGFVEIATYRVEHPSAVGLPKWARRIIANILRKAMGRRVAPMHFYRDHQLVIATRG
jgi:SAM-dependent methyltransferase